MSKTRIVKTTCSICGPCCEVDAYVEDGKLAGGAGAHAGPVRRPVRERGGSASVCL